MNIDHGEKTPLFMTNRRTVLRTATGLAAAAVVGGALAEGPHVAQAQGKAKHVQIIAQIGDRGAFDVQSFSWGVESSFAEVGGGGGVGIAKGSRFNLVKYIDEHTPHIQLAVVQGRHFARATVTFADSNGSEVFSYLFEDVTLTSSQVDATAAGERPTEKVSFAFDKISMVHGDAGYTWNVSDNKSA